jgi:predicted metal-dependent peptidase
MPALSPVDVQGKVLKARIALSLRQPFLASAIMRLPIRDATAYSWCQTMSTDGYHIFYNANWTGKLTQSELRGVLAHEVLHVLFQHSDRRKSREPERWNIATDLAINLILLEQGFVLPKHGLVDRSFWNKSAEEIYSLLPNDLRKIRGDDSDEGGDEEAAGVLCPIGRDLLDGDDPRTLGIRDSDKPDGQQLNDLCASLRQESASKLHGSAAGYFQEECLAHEKSKLDWRALLREWMQDRIKTDWSMWPYSKRHVHRGFFLPSVGVEAPGHIVFAIDTSGSMKSDVISKILSEIRAYRETFPCRLTVLQADATVQAVHTYEEFDGEEVSEDFKIIGRGGTDFRPVFEWSSENAPNALVLYATDGDGTFPLAPPANSVIWLQYNARGGKDRFPFGYFVDVSLD